MWCFNINEVTSYRIYPEERVECNYLENIPDTEEVKVAKVKVKKSKSGIGNCCIAMTNYTHVHAET